MSRVEANIVPQDKTTTYQITGFRVQVRSLDLFNSVTLLVLMLDASGSPRDSQIVKLEGDDYLAWNNDDQYIINKVAEICGFTIASNTA
jgi:hypothetical protein